MSANLSLCCFILSYNNLTHFLLLYRGESLNVTLWDDYATKFINYWKENSNSGPVVIILTHAKYKEPQGVSTQTTIVSCQLQIFMTTINLLF